MDALLMCDPSMLTPPRRLELTSPVALTLPFAVCVVILQAGNAALVQAAGEGHDGCVKMLLDAGSDVTATNPVCDEYDEQGVLVVTDVMASPPSVCRVVVIC